MNFLMIAGIGSFLLCAIDTGCANAANETEKTEISSRFESSPSSLPEPGSILDEEEWANLNEAGETNYVKEIRAWLKTLPPFQQERARRILTDAHPELHDLRLAIFCKKTELATFNINKSANPETLPKLGQELQSLRRKLRSRLENINKRLRIEAGVSMGPLGVEGFWLQPLARESAKQPEQKRPKPNSSSLTMKMHKA